MPAPVAPDPAFLRTHTRILLDSYRRLLGTELLPRDGDAQAQATALYEAPYVVVSHGTQDDPILNYGNRAALTLWETDWAALTAMPSRLTAEPLERAERARLMQRVTDQGFIDDYQGVRITTTGRRFAIARATVWNLHAPDGRCYGQAATFADWTFSTGC